MLSKTFIGCVVAFWAVMMVSLIRVELYPHAQLMAVTPTEVIDKVFHSTDPVHLDVIYRGTRIGSMRLDIEPVLGTSTNNGQTAIVRTGSFKVTGNLLLNMIVFGTPSRLQIRLDSAVFDSKYAIKSYDVHTLIGESRTDIKGDNDERVLDLSYGVGTERQNRHLAYDDLAGKDVFSALGITGMQGLPSFGGASLLGGGSSGKMAKNLADRIEVHAYRDKLKTAHGELPAYLVEIKMDQSLNLWAKLWVDQQGAILQMETSMGLLLRSGSLGADGTLTDRTFERGPRRHP